MKTLVLLLSVVISFNNIEPIVSFQFTDFIKAQAYSQESQKPLLIYYTADWCTPCQMMNETTFKDKYLNEEMNEKYVTVIINQDELESLALIEKHDIIVLPTFQIIDLDDNVLSQSEGSLTGIDFYEFLDIPYVYGKSGSAVIMETGKKVKIFDRSEVSNDEALNVVEKKPFQPGRIEVNENTYAEIQATAVNPKFVKKREGTVQVGMLTKEGAVAMEAEDDILVAPKSTMLEKKNYKNSESSDDLNTTIPEQILNQKPQSITEMESEKVELTVEPKTVSASEEVEIKLISRENSKSKVIEVKGEMVEPKKESLPSSIYIQAGAFRNIANANKLKAKISSKVSEISIIESLNKNNAQLYKVIFGPIHSEEEKEEKLKELKKLGINGFEIKM